MNCNCNYESRISIFNSKFAFRLLGFRLGSEWLQNVRLGWVSQAARAQNTSRQFCKLCQISSSAVLDKVDPAARSETQSIAATSFCTGDWIKRHERKSKYKRWYKMSHISPALFCYKTLGNGHIIDQKCMKKGQKIDFLDLKFLLFSGIFLTEFGGTLLPP